MRDSLEPGICVGHIRHRRFTPVVHEFSYPLFMVLFDIDAIPPQIASRKFALASLRPDDYLGPEPGTLREKLTAAAERPLPGGRILLLTHLRYCGYGFNPISLFYCLDAAGNVERVAAEVHSTFGERHLYWLDETNRDARGMYHAEKKLHVSPFNRMENLYRFALATQREQLTIHIDTYEDATCFFDATLSLRWQPWSSRNFYQALVRFPFMTMQVIASIHWEALKLFLKRVPFVPHPSKSGSSSR